MGSKGQILLQYRTMSPQDQATFRRWLRLNAVVGSIVAAGLVAMALAGSNPDQSGTEIAANSTGGKVAAYALPTRLSKKGADLSARAMLGASKQEQLAGP
jgi:hypothetical protein